MSVSPLRVRARAKKLLENRRYHHGDLHEALIRAGDEILKERGAVGFSLREAARRAGVSPAAPAYHFGNARGLLTEIAALGFKELTRFMRAELAEANATPATKLAAIGRGYARFAFAFPGRFRLMFSSERVNLETPLLQQHADEAFGLLRESIAGLRNWATSADPQGDTRNALMMAWCAVHGYANLVLDRQFDRFTTVGDRSEFFDRACDRMLTGLATMLAGTLSPPNHRQG